MVGEGTHPRPEPRRLTPPPGDWLFKVQGEILGPVPASEIAERMFTGEIDAATSISPEEGEWSTVQDLPEWQPFLFQARAHRRALQARAEVERAARRRRVRNMINLAIGGFALVAVSFVASYLVIVQRPWRDEETLRAWSERHVPLLAIPALASVAGPAAGEDVEADEGGDINIDQILIDDAPALVALHDEGGSKRRRFVRRPPPARDSKRPDGRQPTADTGDTVASVDALSNEEITSKVYARSNMNRLYDCLRVEIRRNPDLPSSVRLMFAIKNDGHVGSVKIDDVRLEDGPLLHCFEQKLAQLRFRPYAGERRNIEIPFNWRK